MHVLPGLWTKQSLWGRAGVVEQSSHSSRGLGLPAGPEVTEGEVMVFCCCKNHQRQAGEEYLFYYAQVTAFKVSERRAGGRLSTDPPPPKDTVIGYMTSVSLDLLILSEVMLHVYSP